MEGSFTTSLFLDELAGRDSAPFSHVPSHSCDPRNFRAVSITMRQKEGSLASSIDFPHVNMDPDMEDICSPRTSYLNMTLFPGTYSVSGLFLGANKELPLLGGEEKTGNFGRKELSSLSSLPLKRNCVCNDFRRRFTTYKGIRFNLSFRSTGFYMTKRK